MRFGVCFMANIDEIGFFNHVETLGYDSAWAAEAWGTDCVSVLAWLGATTSRIKLGSAIMQIPGRTPANTAMTAATLDLLSGGRFLLGLGTSGPQVVEGWHGQPWGKPLGKTREYVEIVRTALRRELLEHHGEHYDIPLRDGTGLGKPLKLMARPLRPSIPIYIAAMSPKAVEQACEIGDGWLPIFWSPERASEVFASAIARARSSASRRCLASTSKISRSLTASTQRASPAKPRRTSSGRLVASNQPSASPIPPGETGPRATIRPATTP